MDLVTQPLDSHARISPEMRGRSSTTPREHDEKAFGYEGFASAERARQLRSADAHGSRDGTSGFACAKAVQNPWTEGDRTFVVLREVAREWP